MLQQLLLLQEEKSIHTVQERILISTCLSYLASNHISKFFRLFNIKIVGNIMVNFKRSPYLPDFELVIK